MARGSSAAGEKFFERVRFRAAMSVTFSGVIFMPDKVPGVKRASLISSQITWKIRARKTSNVFNLRYCSDRRLYLV